MPDHPQKATAQEIHEARVRAWGGSPSKVSLDALLCELMLRIGIDPQSLANEITWKRRELAKYEFASRRTLATIATRHELLESLPLSFPSLRLQISAGKVPCAPVERLLLTGDLRGIYESNSKRASYILRYGKMPEAILTSLLGRPVNAIVDGVPDEREVTGVASGRENGQQILRLTIEPAFRMFQSSGVHNRESVEVYQGPISFGGQVQVDDLHAIQRLHPDAAGQRVFKRPEMSVLPVIITTSSGDSRVCIAIRPRDESKIPRLHIRGVHWDSSFKCYLGEASQIDASELLANIAAAKTASLFCQKLVNDIERHTGKKLSVSA